MRQDDTLDRFGPIQCSSACWPGSFHVVFPAEPKEKALENRPLADLAGLEYWEANGCVPAEDATVRSHEPPDPQLLGELSVEAGTPVQWKQVSVETVERELTTLRERVAGTAADLIAQIGGGDSLDLLPEHDLKELANQAPVVRLVNLLLSEAVEAGASDVHLEASASGLDVRYRLDGVLQDAPSPPGQLRAAVVSRLKIMAELDIAERRLPQDGRIRLRHGNREVDVRVSTLPALHGESVVLRLLGSGEERLGLTDLGMAEDTQAGVRAGLMRTQGVLLATGPTGSGKTTTLYAALSELQTGREKIVAIEDPVEYELSGVTQVPVRDQAGLGFARALRSILRQDPDVLLVGEMRDAETADICVQAALTGHLVLSTLHTRDAPGALVRLLNLGIPEYLVSSTVDFVLAQRLLRRVCEACGGLRSPTASESRAAESAGFPVDRVPRIVGCSECRESGYRGQTGIYELLIVGDEIRNALRVRPQDTEFRKLARACGMRPLAADGWRHVAHGTTSPEEVLRVTAT